MEQSTSILQLKWFFKGKNSKHSEKQRHEGKALKNSCSRVRNDVIKIQAFRWRAEMILNGTVTCYVVVLIKDLERISIITTRVPSRNVSVHRKKLILPAGRRCSQLHWFLLSCFSSEGKLPCQPCTEAGWWSSVGEKLKTVDGPRRSYRT